MSKDAPAPVPAQPLDDADLAAASGGWGLGGFANLAGNAMLQGFTSGGTGGSIDPTLLQGLTQGGSGGNTATEQLTQTLQKQGATSDAIASNIR
ncbi:hypothetical protein [Falsiroseomonas sp. CW058]|uniref:hypothetical protein n=1 Tax=Falsiroseomonas sp. CW058 TaxID=3388664 RepID=UPI003D3147F7